MDCIVRNGFNQITDWSDGTERQFQNFSFGVLFNLFQDKEKGIS